MNINFEELRKQIEEEMNSNKNSDREDSGGDYKILYPIYDGKIILRPFYNLKARRVQRKIIRHDTGSGKIACLQQYGEECPICKAIKEVEDAKGKECGAFSKYGFKTRGICYAQIVEIPDTYNRGDTKYNVGDIVLFMYPKTVYEGINKIMIDSGEHLKEIVSENESIPIVIDRFTKGGGYPSYSISLYPYGNSKAFDTVEEFENTLDNIPNIQESIIPEYPNEEYRDKAKALAETIKSEYFDSSVVNPNDPEDIITGDNDEKVFESTASIADSVGIGNSDKPECYGKYSEYCNANGSKCIACFHELDCKNNSN